MRRCWIAWACWAASLGCGGGEPDPNASTPTYYADVKPILDAKCAQCHDGSGIGPFPLTTYADVAAFKPLVRAAVVERRMPPWLPGPGCTDYLADRSLSDAQIATIAEWVQAGGPEGDPAREGAPLDTGPSYGLSRVDATIAMPAPYPPQITGTDDYRCFVLDWPRSTTTYVTGLRVSPGQVRSVHHVIAFLAPPDQVATVQGLDAADSDPGYSCYGGPGAAAPWLGIWTPGTSGSDFPDGTGIRVDPGSKVVMQVHYSGLNGPAEPDTSAIDVRLDDTVMHEAWIQPWADLTWYGDGAMQIPAGDTDVKHSVELDPTLFVSSGQSFRMYSVGLHMHGLGTKGRLEIHRGGGTVDCLLDMPRWDPHWQGAYGLAEPRVLVPGDRLYQECHWDNGAENQPFVGGVRLPPQDVDWGESVRDEMCLGGFYLSVL